MWHEPRKLDEKLSGLISFFKGTIYMFTLPPSLISWPSLQIFRILWLWSAVCMTDSIPDGCINLVLPCPALTHTYVKMPQILYVSRYTFFKTLPQCLIMHGLQAEQDTHTQKCLKSCMCLNIVSNKSSLMTEDCVVSVNWYITPTK